MNNINRCFWLHLACLALPALSARAAYEDVGVGARVSGLGQAYTALADDAYALYYNPAGLGILSRPELVTSYSKLLAGLSDHSNLQNSFLAYAHPIGDGSRGAWGLAYNQLGLDSLYRERSLYASYGRSLFPERLSQKLFAGMSLKYLNRSLGSVAQASQPLGPTGAVVPGTSDPVLGAASKSNVDFDLGFLYRVKPRWQLGLAVGHLLEPNIAFSGNDTDKLGRNYKLGGAYKTPFSALAADVHFTKAPDSSTDKILALAAEKWLPTLVHGTFGARAGLGIGSRDYRQVSLGLSYKIYRMQVDYGFAIPLAGVTQTVGTHRVGLTFRFGRARGAEPALAEAILENMWELAEVGTPEFSYQMEDLAVFKRKAIEEFLVRAKVQVSLGRFADAAQSVREASLLKPGDPRLSDSHERLKIVSDSYPEIRDFHSDAARASIYEGALKFVSGKDAEAASGLAYARSLNPSDQNLEALIKAVEARIAGGRPVAVSTAPAVAAPVLEVVASTAAPVEAVLPVEVSTPAVAQEPVLSTPVPAGTAPAGVAPPSPQSVVEGLLSLMEGALRQLEYGKVIELADKVIQLDSSNSLAYRRLGVAYYGQKNYPEALKALRSALRFEREEKDRASLRAQIGALTALLERRARPAPKALAPQDIERLYEAGVELYASGRLSEAAGLFKRILEADPDNVSARRALKRVEAEMVQSGERR